MLQKNFKLEVKSVEEDGTFTGYASVTGNVDSDNEVIDKGAFKRTLDHTKGIVPILWQHDRTKPVGWNLEASEDAVGLAVKGKLLIDTEFGRYAQSFLKTGLEAGAKPGLSIGFIVPKGGDYVKAGRRHFKEVAWKEYSIATFQSNLEASVTGAKSEAKTKRVAGEDLSADAFAYVGDPEKTETWKLPIKFSSESKTKRHIRNALARFSSTKDIPDAERPAALAKIQHAAKEHGIDAGDEKSQKDFSESLAETRRMSVLYQERSDFECALWDAVNDVLSDETASADDKKAEIADAYQQYAKAMADWYSRFIDADVDDDAEEDLENMDGKNEKAGRAISVATAEKIKQAMGHLADAGAMHQKAIGILTDLSKQAYTANDVNQPNPVGGGKEEKAAGDPEIDHSLDSLLEMVRSVADRTKAA